MEAHGKQAYDESDWTSRSLYSPITRSKCSGESCPSFLLPTVLLMPLFLKGKHREEGNCKRRYSYTAAVAKPCTEISGRVTAYWRNSSLAVVGKHVRRWLAEALPYHEHEGFMSWTLIASFTSTSCLSNDHARASSILHFQKIAAMGYEAGIKKAQETLKLAIIRQSCTHRPPFGDSRQPYRCQARVWDISGPVVCDTSNKHYGSFISPSMPCYHSLSFFRVAYRQIYYN
jgi:hypothetical protein